MTWTADERSTVANLLLGSWPGTIAHWGREGFAAYLTVLEQRLTAEQASGAILSWEGGDFPPSAPNLAAAARTDPGAPTFVEMVRLVFGPGGVLSARTSVRKGVWDLGERERLDEEAMIERASGMHPLIGAFVRSYRIEKLRALNLDDPDWGGAERHRLEHHWQQHVEACDGRDAAALAMGRRQDGLAKLDPLAALGIERPQIGAGQ